MPCLKRRFAGPHSDCLPHALSLLAEWIASSHRSSRLSRRPPPLSVWGHVRHDERGVRGERPLLDAPERLCPVSPSPQSPWLRRSGTGEWSSWSKWRWWLSYTKRPFLSRWPDQMWKAQKTYKELLLLQGHTFMLFPKWQHRGVFLGPRQWVGLMVWSQFSLWQQRASVVDPVDVRIQPVWCWLDGGDSSSY